MTRRHLAAGGALLASLVLLGACSGGGDSTDAGAAQVAGPDAAEDLAADPDAAAEGAPKVGRNGSAGGTLPALGRAVLAQRRVISTASVILRVDDVRAAAARAEGAVVAAGGYVTAEETTADPQRGGRTVSRLTFKVPPEEFRDVLAALGRLGQLRGQTQSSEDVTEEYVDVEQRIRTQRESLARVRSLLDRAEDLADVVLLEGELTSRQADLEALEARLQLLRDRSDLATISATFESPAVRADRPRNDDDLGFLAGLRDGWAAFTRSTEVLLTATGALLPFLALLVIGWLPGRQVWRTLRTRRRTAGTPVTTN